MRKEKIKQCKNLNSQLLQEENIKNVNIYDNQKEILTASKSAATFEGTACLASLIPGHVICDFFAKTCSALVK